MNLADFQKLNLPDTPGVYFFRDSSGSILYIGKATSLRDRVRSYFSDDLIKTRGVLLVDMLTQSASITYEQTDSVLEAFILETELIKKNQPRYNTKEKDNKSFNYVVFTKEDFPRVLVVRGRNLKLAGKTSKEQIETLGYEYTDVFGPYPYGAELKEAMKIIRKIFPFRDKCSPYTGPKIDSKKIELDESGSKISSSGGHYAKACFNRSIGLCPGVCTGEFSKEEYAKRMKDLRIFFKGKKIAVLDDLHKQMNDYAKKFEFEKANDVKKTIYSLSHIKDISMIKNVGIDSFGGNRGVDGSASDGVSGAVHKESKPMRVEAYDIAHMSGKNAVGVMVVMIDGEFEKKEYKVFNIEDSLAGDDLASLEHVLRRRFAHQEWEAPDAIVIDGGKTHLKRASDVIDVLRKNAKAGSPYHYLKNTNIEMVSVVKDDKHKAREILRRKTYRKVKSVPAESARSTTVTDKEVVAINAECHRFAIKGHKGSRSKSFL
jgi:excinuclease ABC subunit C